MGASLRGDPGITTGSQLLSTGVRLEVGKLSGSLCPGFWPAPRARLGVAPGAQVDRGRDSRTRTPYLLPKPTACSFSQQEETSPFSCQFPPLADGETEAWR